MFEPTITFRRPRSRVKAYTRRQLRASGVERVFEDATPKVYIGKKWLKQSGEMARNTAGCYPDFANLP
jgi:hypothetical protein